MTKTRSLFLDSNSLAMRATHLKTERFTLAESLRHGTTRSIYRGRGVDFFGVREYSVGDDIRLIDKNVSARMGKFYVKLFEEEKELIVFLVVDRSLSMHGGSAKKNRLKAAAETAALFLFATLKNSAPLGAVLFDNDIDFACPPKTGRTHAMNLFAHINTLSETQKKGTALKKALKLTGTLLKNKALIVVISDFRCQSWQKTIAQLTLKHSVLAIQIIDEEENHFPVQGYLPFKESENETILRLPVFSSSFQKAWQTYNKQRQINIQKACTNHGIAFFSIKTNDDIAQKLTNFFKT